MADPERAALEEHAGRLFLAVPLTGELRAALEAHLRLQAGAPLPGRVVPPRNWHLTLRFLGDTPPPRARRLREEMARAELGARFSLRFGECGAFPRPARASVLWLGVAEGGEELARLAAATEAAAVRAGFPPEGRPFTPHLTLSRLRPPADLRPLLQRLPAFPEPLPVTEVALFRSHLGPGPARYEAVERFALR